MISEQNPERSVARDDDQGTEAGNKKFIDTTLLFTDTLLTSCNYFIPKVATWFEIQKSNLSGS